MIKSSVILLLFLSLVGACHSKKTASPNSAPAEAPEAPPQILQKASLADLKGTWELLKLDILSPEQPQNEFILLSFSEILKEPDTLGHTYLHFDFSDKKSQVTVYRKYADGFESLEKKDFRFKINDNQLTLDSPIYSGSLTREEMSSSLLFLSDDKENKLVFMKVPEKELNKRNKLLRNKKISITLINGKNDKKESNSTFPKTTETDYTQDLPPNSIITTTVPLLSEEQNINETPTTVDVKKPSLSTSSPTESIPKKTLSSAEKFALTVKNFRTLLRTDAEKLGLIGNISFNVNCYELNDYDYCTNKLKQLRVAYSDSQRRRTHPYFVYLKNVNIFKHPKDLSFFQFSESLYFSPLKTTPSMVAFEELAFYSGTDLDRNVNSFRFGFNLNLAEDSSPDQSNELSKVSEQFEKIDKLLSEINSLIYNSDGTKRITVTNEDLDSFLTTGGPLPLDISRIRVFIEKYNTLMGLYRYIDELIDSQEIHIELELLNNSSPYDLVKEKDVSVEFLKKSTKKSSRLIVRYYEYLKELRKTKDFSSYTDLSFIKRTLKNIFENYEPIDTIKLNTLQSQVNTTLSRFFGGYIGCRIEFTLKSNYSLCMEKLASISLWMDSATEEQRSAAKKLISRFHQGSNESRLVRFRVGDNSGLPLAKQCQQRSLSLDLNSIENFDHFLEFLNNEVQSYFETCISRG